MSSDPILQVEGLSKTYGSGEKAVQAIGNLTFEVARGEFFVIVGPSGCGKTTLLKCLSGLLAPTSGEARLDGKRIVAPPRELALVFQDYSRSLLPWLTVRKNVLLPLTAHGVDKQERNERAQTALISVGLGKFLDHYPWQLSGGMQQRVALARALAYGSEILLMDEPFASVDAQTRADLEDLVMRIWKESGVTVLFVTHDIDEAVYLADRVVALTPSPTSVRAELTIELPRPRDQVATKELPEFQHLRAHVWRLVKRPDEMVPDDLAEAVAEDEAVEAGAPAPL
jgi:NitT/TauT family transport system ATP-binding protein